MVFSEKLQTLDMSAELADAMIPYLDEGPGKSVRMAKKPLNRSVPARSEEVAAEVRRAGRPKAPSRRPSRPWRSPIGCRRVTRSCFHGLEILAPLGEREVWNEE